MKTDIVILFMLGTLFAYIFFANQKGTYQATSLGENKFLLTNTQNGQFVRCRYDTDVQSSKLFCGHVTHRAQEILDLKTSNP